MTNPSLLPHNFSQNVLKQSAIDYEKAPMRLDARKMDLHLVDEMFSNFDKMSRNEKLKGYGLIITLK